MHGHHNCLAKFAVGVATESHGTVACDAGHTANMQWAVPAVLLTCVACAEALRVRHWLLILLSLNISLDLKPQISVIE